MIKNLKNITVLNVIFYLICFSQQIFANECTNAIQSVSKQNKIPHDILTAVALTETGTMQKGRLAPYPWAINVAGKGFLFSTKQKAIDAVKSYLAQGKTSIDIGCMQLNWYWHKDKFNHSVEKAFDPITNITVGANYIQEHYATYKNWDRAVGRYHSGTEKFAKAYRQKYALNLQIAQENKNMIDDNTVNNNDVPVRLALATLTQSAGSLIAFKPADAKVIALIDIGKKSLPIIDTRRKKPLF
jgi:hypothetical protein